MDGAELKGLKEDFKKIHQCLSSHLSLCRHFESISFLLLSECFGKDECLFFCQAELAVLDLLGVCWGPFYNRPGEGFSFLFEAPDMGKCCAVC